MHDRPQEQDEPSAGLRHDRSTKPHYTVTAAVIRRQDRVLITRRLEHSHLGGLWEFPGGKLEPGEDLRSCLSRELEEELGIRPQIGAVLYRATHEYEDRCITIYFISCSIGSGDPKPIGCQDIRWVPIVELDQYPMPPADREFVTLLQQGRFDSIT